LEPISHYVVGQTWERELQMDKDIEIEEAIFAFARRIQDGARARDTYGKNAVAIQVYAAEFRHCWTLMQVPTLS
jgi:hypothetical protein